MDPFRRFSNEEDHADRPSYPPSYQEIQLRNLLERRAATIASRQQLAGPGGPFPTGASLQSGGLQGGPSGEFASRQQLPGPGGAFPTSASLQGGVPDYMPYDQSRKRKMSDENFVSNVHFDPARQLAANAPMSSFPPLAAIAPMSSFQQPDQTVVHAKKAKVNSGFVQDRIFPAPASLAPAPHSNCGLFQNSARSMLQSFSNRGTSNPPLQNSASNMLHAFSNQGTSNPRFPLQPQSMEMQRDTSRMPLSGPSPYTTGNEPAAVPHGMAEAQPSETHKGGIFDDADFSDECVIVEPPRQGIVAPTSNQVAPESNAMATTGNTGGGIFDDAEEAIEFVPPSYAAAAPIAPKKTNVPPIPKVTGVRPELTHLQAFKPAKVEANHLLSTPAIHPVASPAVVDTDIRPAAAPTVVDTTSKTDSTKAPSRKGKKLKRLLVTRKDIDLAKSILAGKDDLRFVIDQSHCYFLGKEFWIFTVKQLDYVLNNGDSSPSTTELHNHVDRRRQLLTRVAKILTLGGSKGTGSSGEDMNDGFDMPETDTQQNLDPKAEEAAEVLLLSWHTKIEEWKKREDKREAPNEKKFPLDGPIACLFPSPVLRFFASVGLRSLYDFLCLKKTETGAIIAYSAAWRKKCGLMEGTAFAVAKHLLGLGWRAEEAISKVPPPDARSRKWMGDPLVIFTGAAREFIVDDRKVLSGKTFIETRTRDLANALVAWRTTKGLPPLKGSGKVAMISGWKAQMKETIDLEEEGEGQVLPKINFQALLEESEEAPIVKEEAKTHDPVQPVSSQEYTFDPRIPDVDAALHSNTFLREVIDPHHFAALQAAGINTAVELFTADKKHGSPLAREVSKILPDPNHFELVIFDWCQIVRKKLSGIRRVTPAPSSTSKTPSNTAKTTTKKPVPFPAESKTKKTEKPTNAMTETTPPRPSKEDLLQKDPFYSLSLVTQTFLRTVGVNTAEKFMTSRTTDLSAAFVEWRKKKSMSVLKGLGAIASVSGWKAQIRKIAKERGLEDLAHAAPGGTTTVSKPKPVPDPVGKTPPKVKPESAPTPVKEAKEPESKTVLSHPDVLFGRPSKKLVVESSRDPRIRYYFEISIRKKASDIALFISYIGARKLTVVNSEGSIHQRSFTLVENDNDIADVSLLVAKDLSKKIKKDPNSSSAAGKDIRLPFSSLEDGCGLIELRSHDVFPLPKIGEEEMIWPAIKSFIHQEETSEVNLESNVVVGKDENGRSQYFLFLKDPLERGQTSEIRFVGNQSSMRPPCTVQLDNQWRKNVEGMLSRLSRRGLRLLLKFVSGLVVDDINLQIADVSQNDSDPSQQNWLVSRRRAHWIAFKIICQLQGQETKGAKTKSGGIDLTREIIDSYNKVAWTPLLVAELKEHPLWNESTVAAIKKEIQDEFEAGINSNEFLNSSSRRRWCPLANDLYESLLPRVEIFSGFLNPSVSQDTILKEIRESSLTFARELRGVQGDAEKPFEKLVMTFEEFTDGLPCTSPSLKHVLRTSLEQAYMDTLALCCSSPVVLSVPQLQRVVATSEKAPPASEKGAKDASKKPEEASFRTLQDLKIGCGNVHEGWYLRFQLLQVVSSLLSISSVVLDGAVSFKTIVMKDVESTLIKSGVELPKFERSTLSVLGGTPVTFPSEVSGSSYQPNPLPLFLGLIWPTLRSSHWRVEAGDSPTDFSFLPPGQRGRRQRGDRRARMQKQERTRSRIKLAKASNDLGLGVVPKPTKRLIVGAVVNKRDEGKASEGQSNDVKKRVPSATVSDALECFLKKTKGEIGEDNVDGQKRAELLVKHIGDMFDALSEHDNSIDVTDGKRPSDTVGCEHLSRFIIIAPSILHQAQLSQQVVEDTTLILKELASFLTLQQKELFASHFCPPNERYIKDTTLPSVLASCLEKPRSAAGPSKLGEATEAYLPEDRPDVTDFVVLVMSQVIPCRASQEDIAKKNRRISLGFTGLMCRHCKGCKGEGRYFFTSIESMTTASTVIEKHIQKCTSIAPDIKAKMAECRSRHAEQRRQLGQGALARYFLRVWERLRSSKVRDTAASLQLLEMNDKQEDPDEDAAAAASGGLEFESHVHLIEYLKKTQPWSEKQDVIDALKQYYECIETGGRLFNTAAMPRNFNSELLLSRKLASPAQPEPAPTTTASKPSKPNVKP